jgi:hypothetical protein
MAKKKTTAKKKTAPKKKRTVNKKTSSRKKATAKKTTATKRKAAAKKKSAAKKKASKSKKATAKRKTAKKAAKKGSARRKKSTAKKRATKKAAARKTKAPKGKSARKPAPKKRAAKKAVAKKKVAAKKKPAKKAAPKKRAAAKAAAKKPTPKKAAAKKAAAKKVAAKKAAPKKVAAKKKTTKKPAPPRAKTQKASAPAAAPRKRPRMAPVVPPKPSAAAAPGKKAAEKAPTRAPSGKFPEGVSTPMPPESPAAAEPQPTSYEPQRSTLDQAQDLIYDAWAATDTKKRIELAKQALEVSRDCADAYILLAKESAKSLDEELELYRLGVEVGERGIGPLGFQQHRGLFWESLDTRPYMRARMGLAACLVRKGELEQALEHYHEMLRLNTGDAQGARYPLADALIQLGKDDELASLLRRFEDDHSTAWRWTAVLAAFRREGDSLSTQHALKRATDANPHVPIFLLGEKKIPKKLPELGTAGSEDEAVLYAAERGKAWSASSGALDWLRNARGRA